MIYFINIPLQQYCLLLLIYRLISYVFRERIYIKIKMVYNIIFIDP